MYLANLFPHYNLAHSYLVKVLQFLLFILQSHAGILECVYLHTHSSCRSRTLDSVLHTHKPAQSHTQKNRIFR